MSGISAARPRAWYHGWNIVAVCVLSQVAANGLTYNTFSLFLRDWSAELHAPISRLQLSVAAMALVSAFLAPVVGTLATAGWRLIWRGAGLLVAVIVTPLVVLVIRDRPTEAEGAHYLTGDAAEAGADVHGHRRASGHAPGHDQADGQSQDRGHSRAPTGAHGGQLTWRDVASRRNFWLLVAIYLPMIGLYGGCAQNLAPFADSHGLSSQAGGALLSVLSLAHVIATLVLGLVSDRFGNRLPFAGLAVIMVIGAATLAFGSGVPVLTAGCVLVGCGGGLFTLLASAIAREFGAAGVGRAFGLCMLFIPVTGLAPFIIAKTQENTGSYAPGLLSLAVPVIIAGVLSLLLRERRDSVQVEAPWTGAAPQNHTQASG